MRVCKGVVLLGVVALLLCTAVVHANSTDTQLRALQRRILLQARRIEALQSSLVKQGLQSAVPTPVVQQQHTSDSDASSALLASLSTELLNDCLACVLCQGTIQSISLLYTGPEPAELQAFDSTRSTVRLPLQTVKPGSSVQIENIAGPLLLTITYTGNSVSLLIDSDCSSEEMIPDREFSDLNLTVIDAVLAQTASSDGSELHVCPLSCAAGLVGADGPDGESGNKGPAGDEGLVGSEGEAGPTGPHGRNGTAGEQGPVGVQGMQGGATPGLAGKTGVQGEDGVVGGIGLPGVAGAQGPMGVRGKKGPNGSQGDAGKRGVTGAKGPSGAVGEAGAAGVPGREGAEGAEGDQGLQGEAGQDGDAGEEGDAGLPGASRTGSLVQQSSGSGSDYVPAQGSSFLGVTAVIQVTDHNTVFFDAAVSLNVPEGAATNDVSEVSFYSCYAAVDSDGASLEPVMDGVAGVLSVKSLRALSTPIKLNGLVSIPAAGTYNVGVCLSSSASADTQQMIGAVVHRVNAYVFDHDFTDSDETSDENADMTVGGSVDDSIGDDM